MPTVAQCLRYDWWFTWVLWFCAGKLACYIIWIFLWFFLMKKKWCRNYSGSTMQYCYRFHAAMGCLILFALSQSTWKLAW